MGEIKEGPRVELLCNGCRHYEAVRYQVQGDSGYDRYCEHPTIVAEESGKHRGLPNDSARTPDWCPVLTPEMVQLRNRV